MNIKKLRVLFITAVVGVMTLESCKDLDVRTPFDNNAQFVMDSTAMADYITKKGLDASLLDTTVDNVIYAVLEKGSGDTLEFDDIVSFNYKIINTANDTVLGTNIQSVALEYDLYDTIEAVNLAPVKFTLAGSSWTVPLLFGNGDPRDAPYRRIIARTFPNLQIGGHVIMIYPSYSYFVSSDVSDQIISTEVFVTGVRKHLE
ncbi:hypothetical protein [Marinoscillum sp. MHG1-6]|uniref:hypothetical protein n=1 Tax=Marinoscillum sp. MHG1-6 TaxID=2959627 RepID=UPI0021571996|nr:hypothetical protein [Marinoscillum sp. MHG1-6]